MFIDGVVVALPVMVPGETNVMVLSAGLRLPPESVHEVTFEQPYVKCVDSGTTIDEGTALSIGILQAGWQLGSVQPEGAGPVAVTEVDCVDPSGSVPVMVSAPGAAGEYAPDEAPIEPPAPPAAVHVAVF